MSASNSLDEIDGIAVFRPVGACRFEQAVDLVSAAIIRARAQGLQELERFGVVMAANFGLVGNVFDSEPQALTWLRGEDPHPSQGEP